MAVTRQLITEVTRVTCKLIGLLHDFFGALADDDFQRCAKLYVDLYLIPDGLYFSGVRTFQAVEEEVRRQSEGPVSAFGATAPSYHFLAWNLAARILVTLETGKQSASVRDAEALSTKPVKSLQLTKAGTPSLRSVVSQLKSNGASLSAFAKGFRPGLPDMPWLEAQVNIESARTVANCEADSGASSRATHSDDFRSVNWFGTPYTFTANQAACVKPLWENWKRGTPEVGAETILVSADAQSNRLDVVFRGNSAWGTMIVKGSTKGTYRLSNPAE